MKLQHCVALTALAVTLSAASPAQAARRAPDRKALSIAQQLQVAQKQLANMQAQIDALNSKLAALDERKTLTEATLADANTATATKALATAQAAQANAQAAQTAALAAQADVAKTAKSLEKAEKATAAVQWAAGTTISGRLYLNATTLTQHTAGGPNANSGTGVNLKRAYLGIDHRFSPVFAANITLDASNVVGQTNTQNPVAGTTAIVGKGVYLKKAYGEAKLDPKLTIRLGAADTPWVPYAEGTTNHRHVELEMIDRLGYGTSADWGVHTLGDLYKGKGASLSYALSAVNGAGYRQLKVTKTVDFEGRLSGQYKGLYGAIGGYIGKRGANTQIVTGATTFHTAKRFDALLGYKTDRFNLGAEYFYAKDWNDVAVNPATNALSQDSAHGWSFYGNVNLAPKWTAFARYDVAKTNVITDPDLKDHFLMAALQFSPVKIVDIALAYKRETVNGGAINTANGVIGCATAATANSFDTVAHASAACKGNGTYDELGIFAQLRF